MLLNHSLWKKEEQLEDFLWQYKEEESEAAVEICSAQITY